MPLEHTLDPAPGGSPDRKAALVDALRRRILTMQIAPGGVLDEVALSEEFGLSRPPVRELMRQMAGEGYIELEANRPARVAAMNHNALRDFFRVAPMIYIATTKLAAETASVGDVESLRAIQRQFRQAAADADVDGRIFSNNAFHLQIGRIARNAYLMPSLTRLLIDHARIGRTFFRNDPAAREQLDVAADQHDAIIEAIARRDPEEAARLVGAHLDLSRRKHGGLCGAPRLGHAVRHRLTCHQLPLTGATMTDLLTTDDYKKIAGELKLPTELVIGGEKVAAKSGRTFETVNPATGTAIGRLPAAGQEDVDAAVAAARAALDGWSKTHPCDRKAVLLRLVAVIEENIVELAVLESIDSGKTIYDCQTVDLPETVKCLRWHAEAIDKIYDQVAPVSSDHVALVVREPVGVVGLVLPWNFPLLMLAWKIGPALAADCTLVVKPAEETSLSTLRVAGLAAEAGLPAGVLNVVTGTGPEVGEPIGRHPGIDAVSFTGSTETGRRFLRYSADSNLKEVVLEMGGKNPAIVLDDAEDLGTVAAHVAAGAYWNMGENCSAISRLIAQRGIKEALVGKLKAALGEWTVGDPLDPASRVGPLVWPSISARSAPSSATARRCSTAARPPTGATCIRRSSSSTATTPVPRGKRFSGRSAR